MFHIFLQHNPQPCINILNKPVFQSQFIPGTRNIEVFLGFHAQEKAVTEPVPQSQSHDHRDLLLPHLRDSCPGWIKDVKSNHEIVHRLRHDPRFDGNGPAVPKLIIKICIQVIQLQSDCKPLVKSFPERQSKFAFMISRVTKIMIGETQSSPACGDRQPDGMHAEFGHHEPVLMMDPQGKMRIKTQACLVVPDGPEIGVHDTDISHGSSPGTCRIIVIRCAQVTGSGNVAVTTSNIVFSINSTLDESSGYLAGDSLRIAAGSFGNLSQDILLSAITANQIAGTNPTTQGSSQFEIDSSNQTTVILEILKYSGIIIRDPQIVQAAQQELVQDEANEKR